MIDKDLFEVTVKEFRSKIDKEIDGPFTMILEIVKALPGQQITELLKLTYEDLIELICLIEKHSGKQIFNVGQPFGKKKGGVKLVDPSSLPDDGKSLKQKMADLNAHLGVPRI